MKRSEQNTQIMKISHSPWGAVQNQKQIAPGIVSVSTAGHGGIFVSQERRLQMPIDLAAFGTWTEPGWYEEDCDWAVVCLAFPQFFKEQDYYFAVQTCLSYHPELVTPERRAKADAWLAANGDKWTQGSSGTHDQGWFVNAYKLSDPSQKTSKVFTDIPSLPSVFTLEEFENAKLWKESPSYQPVELIGNC